MHDPDRHPCNCDSLEVASKDPDHPIGWDAELHEYYIACGDAGRQVVYFCMFCGGQAPKSRRDDLFHRVSDAERERLVELSSGLRTADEVRERLGEPDELLESAVRYSKEVGPGPPEGEAFDLWTYVGFSDVASVLFEVRNGAVKRARWSAKPLE